MDKRLLLVLVVTVLILTVYFASFLGSLIREQAREQDLLVPKNSTEQISPFNKTSYGVP